MHLPGRILGFHSVLGRGDVTDLPGSVHLIAQAPVLDVVGLRVSVLAAKVTPLRALRHIAIFHQCGRLLRSSRTQIEAHQRQSADRFAPGHELVGAKLIGVQRIPRLVEHPRAILLGANAVEPVVSRDKISAGIPDNRNSQLPYLIDHVFAKAVGIRELRPRIVNSLVDGAAQVLQKRAEEIAIQRSHGASRVHINFHDVAGIRRRRLGRQEASKCKIGGASDSGGRSLAQETSSIG